MALNDSGFAREALGALVDASAAINSSLDLEATLQAIAEAAAEVMQADASSVLLLDKPRRKLVFRAAVGEHGRQLLGEEFDAELGIAGQVAKEGRPMLVPEAHEHESFFEGIDEKSEFTTRGMVAAPLVKKGETIGVVEVLNKLSGQGFNEADLELIKVFANLAASAATNSQAYERLKNENRALAVQAAGLSIVGQAPALKEMLKLCQKVAGSNATVLLLGETGTGKELTSRHIHNSSPRKDKPFVAINCAALPETLLESELFGHEKGSFTGAVSQKHGRFELANGGTLFLDEIGEISHSTQVKLLRVLQEREFVRVGGTKTVACDVRVIAATNRDLQECIKEGTFREDLYYRLSVFPIRTPPLRERREDIALLAEQFVRNSASQCNVAPPRIDDEALAALTSYNWPGNIRELQNVIERAVLLCEDGVIRVSQLPREIVGDDGGNGDGEKTESSLWGYEKALIVRALKEHDWNQTQAAKSLGISRDNLRYRIKKYEINKPD